MRIWRLSRLLWRGPGLATVAMLGAIVSATASEPIPVAIVDFDYTDTSGELRDQTSEHAKRLADFAKTLRDGLAATRRFRPVEIACASPPCTARNTPAPALIEAARAAGARLLVYGGIQKMSTLIQWGKLEVVDLQANRLIGDKMLTFRGDSDEAWHRPAAFAVDEIKDLDVRE